MKQLSVENIIKIPEGGSAVFLFYSLVFATLRVPMLLLWKGFTKTDVIPTLSRPSLGGSTSVVTVEAKARAVTVKGPRGTLHREFKHIDVQLTKISPTKLKVLLWHAGRKHAACLRTIASGILNMIKGVTKV